MRSYKRNLSRREFLQAATATTVAWRLPGVVRAGGERARPNVLFIAVDDLRDELGCFGASYADTPNIDKLAATGVRFTNHFVQVPTCGASRYALLMGRSPANSGVTASNTAFYQGNSALSKERLERAQSMPELFRRNGYYTVCIGKMSHTPDGRVFGYDGTGAGEDEVPFAWDELATPLGKWKRGWGAFFGYEGGRHREDGEGNKDLMEFTAKKDEDLPDGLLAKAAVEKLSELKGKGGAFFLGVGFYKPHLPFVGTEEDWEAMSRVEVPVAGHQEKPDSSYWHSSEEFYKYDTVFEKDRPLAEQNQLKAKRAYLGCVRFIDRQIGKVLRALDELGLAENTVVVLWGDHGWHLGDSQIWGKHTPFERAVRSPLIIRTGAMKSAGKECDALVETVDIYPTLVAGCLGVKPETQYPLDGMDLAPLFDNPDADIREAALSYWKSAVSVRTKTHRLIVDINGDERANVELYDIRESPDPLNNIASSRPELVEELLKYVVNSQGRKGV